MHYRKKEEFKVMMPMLYSVLQILIRCGLWSDLECYKLAISSGIKFDHKLLTNSILVTLMFGSIF